MKTLKDRLEQASWTLLRALAEYSSDPALVAAALSELERRCTSLA